MRTRLAPLLAATAGLLCPVGSGAASAQEEMGEMMGLCKDNPAGVVFWFTAMSQPAPGPLLKWELRLRMLEAQGPRPTVWANVDAVRSLGFIPAAPALSWRTLDNGTRLLWSTPLLVVATPVPDGSPELQSATLDLGGTRCEGVAWNPPALTNSGIKALLVVPEQTVALAVTSAGKARAMTLTDTVVAKPARRKRRWFSRFTTPSPLLSVGNARIQSVSCMDNGTVVSAWRLAVEPGGSEATLRSQSVLVDGVNAVHRVVGTMTVQGREEEVVLGVLVEPRGNGLDGLRACKLDGGT